MSSHLVLHQRAALGIAERSERVVGHGHADRLAVRGGGIVLDRGVEPELAVLLVHLAGPGVLLDPRKVGRLHDRAVERPRLHVLGRIGEPFGDVEHLLAARLVVPDVEVERVADDQRGGIGRVAVADERVAAVDEGLAHGGGRRSLRCGRGGGARSQHQCAGQQRERKAQFHTSLPKSDSILLGQIAKSKLCGVPLHALFAFPTASRCASARM